MNMPSNNDYANKATAGNYLENEGEGSYTETVRDLEITER